MSDELDLDDLARIVERIKPNAWGFTTPLNLPSHDIMTLLNATPKLIAIAQAVNAARADKGLPPVNERRDFSREHLTTNNDFDLVYEPEDSL